MTTIITNFISLCLDVHTTRILKSKVKLTKSAFAPDGEQMLVF